MKDYLTVKELLEQNYFQNFSVIAGKKGLNNKVKHVVVLETPDGMHWLKGNEIVLTAGHAFINNSDYKNEFIETAKKYNAAAIGIKLGRYYGEIDNSLIEKADRLNIPVFILDKDAIYSDFIGNFYELLFNVKNKNILNLNYSYFELLNLQTKNASINEITEKVSELIGKKVEYIRYAESPDFELKNNLFRISSSENFGYLSINRKYKLSDFSINCIKYALSLIHNKFLIEQQYLYSISQNHRIITQLLLNSTVFDEEFYDSIITNLNWKNRDFYCIYFKIDDSSFPKSEIRKFIEYEYSSNFLYTTDPSGMAVFINISSDDLNSLLDKFARNFYDSLNFINIGVSLLKKNFSEINTAYDEAKKISKNNINSISFMKNYPNQKLLFTLTENNESKVYFKNIISKIKDYDNKNNTELYTTLKCYIQNNLNRKHTSANMHIHVETLRYRLKCIENLLDIDLYNSSDLMLLLIAAEIDEYL